VLVLGASSGFGAASARALAEAGYHVFGVHLDRRQRRAAVEAQVAAIEATGRRALFCNGNAADPQARSAALDRFQAEAGPDARLHLLLHSLAFGSLAPLVPPLDAPAVRCLQPSQLQMTLEVMASSLLWWVQDLLARELFAPGARILALTSAGSLRALPNYGALAAAKAALEALVRQLALELAPRGLRVNALRAGVCDTPALRQIPDAARLLLQAEERNPSGRLTRPEDVARAVVASLGPGFDWITGATLPVDGGELLAP